MTGGHAKRTGKGLTAALVRSPLASGKYHDGGGLGLYLRVDPNGGRFWVQRITVMGKRRELGLGSPPVTTLAAARDKAIANKRLVRDGGDPLAAKREAVEMLTFADAMGRYLETKLAEFENAKHRQQWVSTLEAYAVPIIGSKPVNAIEMHDVLRVLEPIWNTKNVTAMRLRGRIEMVLSWATVAGYRTGDNPARWQGNLSEMLTKPGKVTKVEHKPALSLADAPRWWRDLERRATMAARALQFVCLTAARSSDVRGMVWSEVDMNSALWTVPAERMKMRHEHRVPLTAEALAMLKALPRLDGNSLVFAAPQGGVLADKEISEVMKRMQRAEVKRLLQADLAAGREPSLEPCGYIDARTKRPAVPHGLRSTFRDWAAEQGYDRDLAEMALAHNVGSQVERAYRRTDLVERRRAMLDSWGCFLRGETGEKVVQMRAGV
jgi:integrase